MTDDDAFQGRLLSGERIVWSGRPLGGLRFTARDLFLVPFSLMWCGFAISWEWGVNEQPAPIFFRLWGVPFVLIGLYVVAGRFVVDMWARSCTRYAVTTRRILILRNKPFLKFIALPIDRLPELSLRERSDGSGTIDFVSMWGWNNRSMGAWSPALDANPHFLAIADARAVFNQIQKLSAGKPPGG